jgi:hypothetical protein
VAATASGRLLAAFRSRLLAPSLTAVSNSVFCHSSLTTESGLLVVVDIVGSSTWSAGATALWNASMYDTASTYFLATHGKRSLCKFDPNIGDLSIFMKN